MLSPKYPFEIYEEIYINKTIGQVFSATPLEITAGSLFCYKISGIF
jgi:hypothetical protein